MQKSALNVLWLSLAAFFVTLSLVVAISSYMLLRNDGDMFTTIAANAFHKMRITQSSKRPKGPVFLERALDKLLANDARLLSSILRQSFRRPLAKDGHTPTSRALQGAFQTLLANDAHLLVQVIKGIRNQNRVNPAKYLIDQLLASNGRLLKQVVRVLLQNNRTKRSRSKGMLVENKGAIADILSQVLREAGVTRTLRDVRGKIRGINTKLDLKTEVRRMLASIPRMVIQTIDLNQKRKMKKNRDWRGIKAQFPKIRRAILQHTCLRFAKLRRGKNNQLYVRARVKLIGKSKDNRRCVKLACRDYVNHIDQAVLRHTRNLGMHEGLIRIKFNLRMRRCNSNR